MKPLRIAFLKATLHASGGLEKYCLRLYDALSKRGHTVTILSTSSRTDLPVTKICCRLRPSALNLLWFDYHCRQYLSAHPQDVVIGFDRHFLPLTYYRAGNGCHAAYLARRAKESSMLKRLSFSLNPLHFLTLLSEQYTFERTPAAHIICNSHLVEHEIEKYYPKTPRSSLTVIHNGVEWHEFEPHFQQKISSPKDPASPLQLLFIGHEWERKGLDRLLNALGLIKEAFAKLAIAICEVPAKVRAPISTKPIVVTMGEERSELELCRHEQIAVASFAKASKEIPFHLTAVGRELHPHRFVELAKALHIEDKVTFVPEAQKSLPYYKAAQIAIIPSRYDPFANVTLEALAMGLFVITTTANGGSEAITPNLNGIVLDENASSFDLSQAIVSAMSFTRDPNLPMAIRESVKDFDFSQKLEEYIRLIEQ